MQPNPGKIFLVLLEGPKVGPLQPNLGKTALIYSVVTIYLGLRPRINIDLKDIMELYCNVNHLFEVGGLTGERRASQV